MKNPAEGHPESSSVPPGGGAPVPAEGPSDEDVLWLVSFDDDDNRELRPSGIAAALRRGEIDQESIVWREGLEDWAPLRSISSLARLLPSVTTPLGHAPPIARTKGDESAKGPAHRAPGIGASPEYRRRRKRDATDSRRGAGPWRRKSGGGGSNDRRRVAR